MKETREKLDLLSTLSFQISSFYLLISNQSKNDSNNCLSRVVFNFVDNVAEC